MSNNQLTGQVVKEWLDKWPDLPSRQLARMIYKEDNNKLLFRDEEAVRRVIRYYRGASGEEARNELKETKYIKPLKKLI